MRVGFAVQAVSALFALTGLVTALVWVTLNAPLADRALLALFLLFSGGVTLAVGYLVPRYGLGQVVRTVRGKLLFALILAVALALVNVGFTSYLMFISTHDLGLLVALLLFSLGISIFLALSISNTLQSSMQEFLRGVRLMSAGQFTSRITVHSRDEWEELASAFNMMAERLEAAFQKETELEQARRQLVAAVSHDLRSPLASMRVMVESINDGVVTDSETVHRYLRTLQGEVEYLSRLIDDLFELSQFDSGLIELRMGEADIKDLIMDTVAGLSAQAEQRQLTLRGSVDGQVPALTIDAQRIQRVLYNLLQNAIRHTPADGTILVEARDAGAEVQVSVIDTGEGIAAADIPRLFERFHKGDKARTRGDSGSGLGLSITKGIVEAHGGRIWVVSAPGSGTAFTFALPKATATAPAG